MPKSTISEMKRLYEEGATTPSEVVAETFACIEEKDEEINAYLETYQEEALASAERATQAYQSNESTHLPLLGIPVAIKNNILIKGKRATGGSKILENYQALYSATVIDKLEKAGAIIVGSTNLDEFAMGSSTENSAFGPTKNPVDISKVPGGSSGGSAAAVAVGSVPVALGTDTGGSIRQPASFCGLVGFKPTYGAVSRYGLMAMGSSFDQAGPLTNTVADAQLVHNIIKGQDSMDMTSISDDTYQTVPVKENYNVGVPSSFLTEGVDEDVLASFEEYIKSLEAAGHTVVDVDLPLFEKGLAAYYISIFAEVSSNLARYDGMRYGKRVEGADLLEEYVRSRAEGLGSEAKRRILLGTYVLSAGYYDAYYTKAEAVRELMRQELQSVFSTVDVLLTPTTPTPAFAHGANEDPLTMYKQDVFTVPVNLTGVPAISIPMKAVQRDNIDLPVGVQYIAPHGGEERLFDIGSKMHDSRVA